MYPGKALPKMKLPSHLTKNASSEAHASLNQTSASQVVDLNEIDQR